MHRFLQIVKATSDPSRVRILNLLRYAELAVSDLTHILRQSQPRISRHLKILTDSQLIERHKEGAWVFFRLMDGEVCQLLLSVMDAWIAPGTEVLLTDLSRLRSVQNEHTMRAEKYFAAHAQEWDSVRSLYISEIDVEKAIIEALKGRPIDNLLDIGTGTGRILEVMSPYVGRAVGIDSSQEMLRLARARLEASNLLNAQVRLGDMYALAGGRTHDAIIIHQVLHYAEAPHMVITEAARVLSQNGRLLVADFAPHDKEFLREEHAHRRLGFGDQQITDWMESSGLTARVLEKLHGGELAVTIWLGEKL